MYAHLDDDLARKPQAHEGRHPLPEPDAFAQTLGRLGIGPEDRIVAYDDAGGAIAARLWWMLGWIGHEARWLLDGGLTAWQAAGYGLEAGACQRPPVTWPAVTGNDQLIATTAQVSHGVGTLLDARAAPRFRGEAEPIDPVAGHVPGAANLPFDALLGPDRCFLPQRDLQNAFAAALPDHGGRDSTVTTMCGSGVTACHLLAGLAILGRSGKLYAGSWSEWIRDPARAVATHD